MNTSPLDIPEILRLICQILKRKDQVVCMRVNQGFYNASAPYVWKSTKSCHKRRKNPDFLRGLQRNMHHIQTLHLQDCDEVDVIYQSISQDRWSSSRLESLVLSNIPVSDQVLATVLRHTHQLKTLNADGTRFGHLSLQALVETREIMQAGEGGKHVMGVGPRRLCESIEELHLHYCSDVAGGMVQTILENCPKLLRLYADCICIPNIVDGRAWVCTKLEVFHVHIRADFGRVDIQRMAMHRAVHAQLARLTKLQSLNISDWEDEEDAENPTLDLRLESGLDQLGSLQDLEDLEFRCEGGTYITAADAHWMVNNWPAMKNVSGNIFGDEKEMAQEIEEILEAKDITAKISLPSWTNTRRGP
ncbi:hypothetical protein BGZ97_008054 [Linnemannia gamsii]|jgi:hypothetical protein|uniref:Uncharacterized protein n=1 Tax=Linnemannia gamsii TaxID=64522 RepID=A0A9P6QPU0_9FUNG|nr:hypothetical protein BGZ97_008054 [Linnemannia gamsii]